MKTLDNDSTALPSYVAIADAKAQHEAYWPLHTAAKQQASLQLKELVAAAYFRSRVYLTAREKFITVKVSKPNVRDKLQNVKEMAALDAFLKQHNIKEAVPTKISLLFHVAK